MLLPKEMLALVKAARAVVKARLELRLATKHEASDKVLEQKRSNLRKALDNLERDVLAFDKQAEAQTDRKRQPFDWHGAFRVTHRLIDLAHKVRQGAPGPEVVRGVQDVIEGEVVE